MEILRDTCQFQVGIKLFKEKKQLSIVHVRFNFTIWDDIRQFIDVKCEQ